LCRALPNEKMPAIFDPMDSNVLQNLPLLKSIYGEAAINQQEDSICNLFAQTETSWLANAKRLQGHPVKYILITEAPCTKGSVSQYFYNNIESPFHKKIWKGVFPNEAIPADMEKAYTMLAEKGFLLIDSIPFSLKFSGKRDKKAYTDLMVNGLTFLQQKLNHPQLNIHPNAVVAFAFKVNAQKLIEAAQGSITLKNGQTLALSQENIAADASGYTNSALLSQIFGQ
jgi:hypothetical protein